VLYITLLKNIVICSDIQFGKAIVNDLHARNKTILHVYKKSKVLIRVKNSNGFSFLLSEEYHHTKLEGNICNSLSKLIFYFKSHLYGHAKRKRKCQKKELPIVHNSLTRFIDKNNFKNTFFVLRLKGKGKIV